MCKYICKFKTRYFLMCVTTSYEGNKKKNMSRLLRTPTLCMCENIGADQLRGDSESDQRICFRHTTRIVQSPFFVNTKFHASSCLLLWLYSPVCAQPGQKPQRWFSYEAAHILFIKFFIYSYLFQRSSSYI